MVFFSAFMMHAYNWNEYVIKGEPRTTKIWRPLWDRYVPLAHSGVIAILTHDVSDMVQHQLLSVSRSPSTYARLKY